ncbi:hypothetical protein ACSBR1_036042 [Camellia fascicularis]
MEATTIPFSTLTSCRFSLNSSSSSSLPIHKTLSSSNSTKSTTISSSWAASTLSVAFSSRNSFTRELWGLLNSKAEMFCHLTNGLESSWNKLKGEAFPNNSPLSLSSFAMPKSGSTRLPRASSRNTILHCGRFELRYTKFRQQRANIQKSQFLTTAPSKKKKTPPDDHSIHSYSSENNLPLPDPDIGKIHWKRELSVDHSINVDLVALVQTLRRKNLPHVAQEILLEINSGSLPLDNSALSALMLCYADNGLFHEAQAIWDEVLNSSFRPNIHIISELIEAYGRMGRFDDVTRILHQASLRDSNLLPEIYVVALSCFGKQGQLELMENTLREMGSRGFSVDSAIGNSYIIYYSLFGSLTEIEAAYGRLKRSRILIEKEGIRAMSLAYIKEKKFYRLGEFLRDVGLGRRNVGNLLWNLLLLSYAANFKMKTLQREFLRMVEAGFHPDLTTFNIRALAFSKMSLFWDLHLSLEHMKHEQVVPDLVTYGCIVDAYLDKRLGMNLDFALSKMNVHASPQVFTDPFVFEVLGKGDFHSSSEAFLEFKRKNWTYKELISTYLKKKYRSNQLFWNY